METYFNVPNRFPSQIYNHIILKINNSRICGLFFSYFISCETYTLLGIQHFIFNIRHVVIALAFFFSFAISAFRFLIASEIFSRFDKTGRILREDSNGFIKI